VTEVPGGGPSCDMDKVRRILEDALGTQMPPLTDEQAEQARQGMAGMTPLLPDPWTIYLLGLRHGVQYALTHDRCCDFHSRTCEPPSELCCAECSECAHPAHADGSVCIAPDMSSLAVLRHGHPSDVQ
jgi:hypothetical protein